MLKHLTVVDSAVSELLLVLAAAVVWRVGIEDWWVWGLVLVAVANARFRPIRRVGSLRKRRRS